MKNSYNSCACRSSQTYRSVTSLITWSELLIPPPHLRILLWVCIGAAVSDVTLVLLLPRTQTLRTIGSYRYITDHFTCTSSNVAYICNRCHIIYVGETCRRLADCFMKHLRSIMDILVMEAIKTRGNNVDHVTAEHKLIIKLSTVHPRGLNSKFDTFSI